MPRWNIKVKYPSYIKEAQTARGEVVLSAGGWRAVKLSTRSDSVGARQMAFSCPNGAIHHTICALQDACRNEGWIFHPAYFAKINRGAALSGIPGSRGVVVCKGARQRRGGGMTETPCYTLSHTLGSLYIEK